MKKLTTVAISLAGCLALVSCGSGPEKLDKAKDAQKWIEKSGYECASFKENSKSHGVCYLKDGGSLIVSVSDDPIKAAAGYLSEASFVGVVRGENWIIPCRAKQLEMCGQIASAHDLKYLPNPKYL